MRFFLEAESDQIILSYDSTFHRSSVKQGNGFANYRLPCYLDRVRRGLMLPPSLPPYIHIICSRILTTYPSDYTPFKRGTSLGPTNPPLTYIAEETLGIRWPRFSRDYRYSYRHSHFFPLHHASRHSFTAKRTLPYQSRPKDENLKYYQFPINTNFQILFEI